jgi:DNA polymerase IV
VVRKIIHVDMDAFYAAVEQRDRPELRGRPVVVGGDPRSRGVVSSASYEARAFGIRSAMPSSQARRLCPHTVFLMPDMARYREASRAVFAVFRSVTDLVEPLSIDEAYLDVTENTLGEPLAGRVAIYVRARILEETGLTASAGVGPNKLVAKIASDLRKPDGLVIVPPAAVAAFVAALPVEKLWGVGPATARRLHECGLRTAADLSARGEAPLRALLGDNQGAFLWRLASGDDQRPVRPGRAPKSRGAEHTFQIDVVDAEVLDRWIVRLATRVAGSLARSALPGRTVTLKLRYSDFETITRSRTLSAPTADAVQIARAANELLDEATAAGERPVRLLGVSVGGLVGAGEPVQLPLPLPEHSR